MTWSECWRFGSFHAIFKLELRVFCAFAFLALRLAKLAWYFPYHKCTLWPSTSALFYINKYERSLLVPRIAFMHFISMAAVMERRILHICAIFSAYLIMLVYCIYPSSCETYFQTSIEPCFSIQEIFYILVSLCIKIRVFIDFLSIWVLIKSVNTGNYCTIFRNFFLYLTSFSSV